MTDVMQDAPVEIPGRPFGRIVRSVFSYALLIGVMSFPPFTLLLPAAVFFCGTRNGRAATWLAFLLGAALAAGVVNVSTAPKELNLEIAGLASVVLGIGLPALVTLPLIERNGSFGNVLASGLGVSMAGIALAEYGGRLLGGVSLYAGTVKQFQVFSERTLAEYQKQSLPFGAMSQMRQVFAWEMKVIPAILLMIVVIALVLSILLFGRVRAWLEFIRTREVSPANSVYLFRNLSLPEWLPFAFVLGGLTPFLSGLPQVIAANILAVTLFLFFLQGAAVLRAILTAIGVGVLGNVFAFTLTLLLVPFMFIIAGLFDPFFDFRKFRRKDDSNESHTD